jgi:hypothetical protein
MTDKPLNFDSEPQRRQWIIDHAEYFVACRIVQRRRERAEAKSLQEAREKAVCMLAQDSSKPILIYAVNNVHDTYVETVRG